MKQLWLGVVLMNWLLVWSGCAKSLPPCNEEDVQLAYDKTGKARKDGAFLTYECIDRIKGDLNTCYKGKAQ